MNTLQNLMQHVDWRDGFLVAMAPVFIVAFLIEWHIMRGRGAAARFKKHHIAANLGLGASYLLFEVAAKALISIPAALWVYEHRIFSIAITPLTIIPAFIGVEFCYYWFHRASHRVRWFWSAHVVHHSGLDMNMTTAMRQSLLYSITGWWIFFLPLVWLGIHPLWVFFLYSVDLAYQYFVHTEAVGKLPRWAEYWLNTPSNHRAHHGRNPQYIDHNYGGVLMIFDRWFGTYVEEREPVDYGIPRQIYSHNLFTLNFHEFRDMWRGVFRPGSLYARLKHLWGPPDYERPL
jgi:sterol desaturase/sphingolipid hydroxylase (fatty acid hydroxylase superfamily)